MWISYEPSFAPSTDASTIATFVTPDPGLDIERVREKVTALEEKCRRKHPAR